MASEQEALRRPLLARLGWIALAAGIAVGVPAAMLHTFTEDGHGAWSNVQRAAEVADWAPSEEAVVVDTPGILDWSAPLGGGSTVTVERADGERVEAWTDQNPVVAIFAGPDEGDVLEVAVDSGDPPFATVVDAADSSRLAALTGALGTFLGVVALGMVAARRVLQEGEQVPLRGVLSLLLRTPSRLPGTLVEVRGSSRTRYGDVTLRIAAGGHEYSWDVVVPHTSLLRPGHVFDLRGRLADGGWMAAVDPRYGPMFPRAPLRRWGEASDPGSWHPGTR